MASVIAVCISEKKGTMKHPVKFIDVKPGYGILGNAHAGTGIGRLAFSPQKVWKR